MSEWMNSDYPVRTSLNEMQTGTDGDVRKQRGDQHRELTPTDALGAQVANIRDRRISIETRTAALASKEDIATMRGDLLTAMTSQTWKMITWTFLIGAAIVGGAFSIAKMSI